MQVNLNSQTNYQSFRRKNDNLNNSYYYVSNDDNIRGEKKYNKLRLVLGLAALGVFALAELLMRKLPKLNFNSFERKIKPSSHSIRVGKDNVEVICNSKMSPKRLRTHKEVDTNGKVSEYIMYNLKKLKG